MRLFNILYVLYTYPFFVFFPNPFWGVFLIAASIPAEGGCVRPLHS